jgi:hypothetical protein
MHAMPIRRNLEVSDEVLDGPRSLVVEQAANRLHATKALLLTLFGQELCSANNTVRPRLNAPPPAPRAPSFAAGVRDDSTVPFSVSATPAPGPVTPVVLRLPSAVNPQPRAPHP